MADSKEKILVVDDMATKRALVRIAIQSLGIEIIEVTGGQEALDRVSEGDISLVILDIKMPDIDGLEVLQTLRRDHSIVDLPIIMHTSSDDSEFVVSALASGANDYVTTPCDPEILVARVNAGLSRRKAEQNILLAKKKAEQANRAKSEFLSSMSHELRTPLNAILGFAQMLEFNPKEPLSETQKKSVSHILSAGQHLLELINEVLDLSKIEAGKLELDLEEVSIMDVLESCLPLIGVMAEEKNIEISAPDTAMAFAPIYVDLTCCKQILLNLLSNAIKYNRDGGSVTVSIQAPSDGMLHIDITDTGQGIPEDKHNQIFSPFNRLGAENSTIVGTGIGLTVTKQLVEAMGGRIGFESEAKKGTTFWVQFPKSE